VSNEIPIEPAADNSALSADEIKVKNKKLKDLLDDLDLTPEQTRDDISKLSNRDSEILGDVPPHHGN